VSSITEVDAPTIALIAYLPPSIAELNSLITRANEIDAKRILLCALVSRTPAPDGEVQPSGLLRAITSAVKELQGSLPTCQITPLAVPWPKGDLNPEDLVRAYGATEVVTGAERYPANAPTGYPVSSAQEIERARNTAWGKGAVVLFTGLSGSGKSTIAAALAELLRDEGARGVALLDAAVTTRDAGVGPG
jgi:sulfate adenylyltransferase